MRSKHIFRYRPTQMITIGALFKTLFVAAEQKGVPSDTCMHIHKIQMYIQCTNVYILPYRGTAPRLVGPLQRNSGYLLISSKLVIPGEGVLAVQDVEIPTFFHLTVTANIVGQSWPTFSYIFSGCKL